MKIAKIRSTPSSEHGFVYEFMGNLFPRKSFIEGYEAATFFQETIFEVYVAGEITSIAWVQLGSWESFLLYKKDSEIKRLDELIKSVEHPVKVAAYKIIKELLKKY